MRARPLQPDEKNDDARKPYMVALTGQLVVRTYRLGTGRHLLERAVDSDISIDDEVLAPRRSCGGEYFTIFW